MANSWKNLVMLEQKNELRERSHENGATFHFLNVYFRIFFHPDGFHENGAKAYSKTVQRRALSRSRRELSNEYLLVFAKFGFDTAKNEPCKNSHFLTLLIPEF